MWYFYNIYSMKQHKIYENYTHYFIICLYRLNFWCLNLGKVLSFFCSTEKFISELQWCSCAVELMKSVSYLHFSHQWLPECETSLHSSCCGCVNWGWLPPVITFLLEISCWSLTAENSKTFQITVENSMSLWVWS